MTAPLVYFFPHAYLRDRQLDLIRAWPAGRALNPEIAEERRGAQVGRRTSLGPGPKTGWRQRLPLLNLKRRPPGIAREAAVYVWGAVVASGPFIVDLDNPYALTGYNLRAMALWRGPLRRLLRSPRCLEIRCLSAACRATLGHLFGAEVAAKARVHYPRIEAPRAGPAATDAAGCRFLFVATQFEIKGGAALLNAFARVRAEVPAASLDLVTHLPPAYQRLAAETPGVAVHPATFSRAEIAARFLGRAQVLVHPTYVESFGMVVLEALAHGLALIATDVYALGEMVEDGVNGSLLAPPLSIWRGAEPAALYFRIHRVLEAVRAADTGAFERRLAAAMIALGGNPDRLRAAQRASADLFRKRFRAGP